MGANKQEPQRRSGSGKGVLLCVLSVKANGTGATSEEKVRVREAQMLEVYQQRTSRAMSPLTALFWVPLAKWGACGWAVVQSYYDEELGPLHGMYGSMEAEFEVQRVIKRASLTAFLCLVKKVSPIKVHVRNYRWAMERKKKMRRSESWRCRPVDPNLGRVASSKVKRKIGGRGACQGAPLRGGQKGDVAI